MIRSFLLMLLALIVMVLVTLPLIVINLIRKVYRRENIQAYFHTIAIGFDQAGGSILYGQEDWTVSSWTYRLSAKGNGYAAWFMRFIDFFFGRDHCKESFMHEAMNQGEVK